MIIPPAREALNFLLAVYPEGPWALTVINVDRKGIETETFYPKDEQKLIDWIEHFNGRSNCYWHVNPVIRPISKKAERTDILSVNYLHVDIDATKTRPKADILGALESGHSGVPLPTVIISSGGGYQAFWKLETPIPINGELELAEKAKLYNQQLETVFKADNCHNIDRLCRLPGTMNLPDAKKRARGRVACPALVHTCHLERVYPIDTFQMAVITQLSDSTTSFPPPEVPVVSANIRRLTGTDDPILVQVPPRIKEIMVQGRTEEAKPNDNSRSAWLFDCLCGLVRADCSDETMYSIITDPDFKISESVLEMGHRAERYALRQIARAREEAVHPMLRELNDRHAVIGNWGNQCRVIEEVEDGPLGRTKLTRQSFDDFRNRYMNKYIDMGTVNGQPQQVPAGKWWLNHPKRRQYSFVTFSPSGDKKDCYNLWRGFACSARAGDCRLYLAHLSENICNGNKDHLEYLLNWMARCVQQPDSQGETAVVLRGKQGTGKGVAVKWFGKLFGRHYLQVADAKHMVGNFNAHLRDTVVLFADEAFWAGDKKHEAVLKMLVTEDTLAIESKGVDVVSCGNYVHLIMASNSQWVVPAKAEERRFFILDVADNQQQNTKYFADITQQMENGGMEALLHFLMTRDIKGWQVRTTPKTNALMEQKLFSLSPEEEWWQKKMDEGAILDRNEEWPKEVWQRHLINDYVEYMRRINEHRRINETLLKRFLSRAIPGYRTRSKMGTFREMTADGRCTEDTHRETCIVLPPLEVCREAWEKITGIAIQQRQPELYPLEDSTPVEAVM